MQVPVYGSKEKWISIRLELIIEVIKNVLGLTFKLTDLQRLISDCPFATTGKAEFYRMNDRPWPIIEERVDGGERVPLAEDELRAGAVRGFAATFFKEIDFNNVVNGVHKLTANTIDYYNIQIDSLVLGKCYLAKQVNERTWYGFRAIESSNLSVYCGIRNYCDIQELDPNFKLQTVAEVDECLRPYNLFRFYNYTSAPDDSHRGKLPPALRICPFPFRNDFDDVPDIPMPNDESSLNYYLFFRDDFSPRTPTKRGRDDELRSGGSASQQSTPAGSTPLGSRPRGVANTPLSSGGTAVDKQSPLSQVRKPRDLQPPCHHNPFYTSLRSPRCTLATSWHSTRTVTKTSRSHTTSRTTSLRSQTISRTTSLRCHSTRST